MASSWALSQTLTFQKMFVFIYFNKSPLKMMKKAFYFMLKALLFTECGVFS